MASAYILHGYSDIVNPDNVKPGINLKDLERDLITGGHITKAYDPRDKFSDELREQTRKLGISLDGDDLVDDDPADVSMDDAGYEPMSPRQDSFDARIASPKSAYGRPATPRPGGSGGGSTPRPATPRSGGGNYTSSGGYGADYSSKSWTDAPSTPRSAGGNWGSGGGYGSPRRNNSGVSFTPSSELQSRTYEQQRRSHIDSVMEDLGGSGGKNFTFEVERENDMKCILLAEIDSLITELRNEDVDISRIPEVSLKSDYAQINDVCKIYRHKRDMIRYCSLAEEGLLCVGAALESLFDGKNTWFSRYSPDLTGVSSLINCKIRRCRHDTSAVVGSAMENIDAGPITRLALELIPAIFLYSHNKKKSKSQPGLASNEEIMRASERIRSLA